MNNFQKIDAIFQKNSIKKSMKFASFQVFFLFLVMNISIDYIYLNTLKFIVYDQNVFQPSITFLKSVQIDKKIFDYDIDKYGKCIYYLVKNAIISKCYGGEIIRNNLVVTNSKIIGISLDHINNYLYYYNHHTLFIMNLETRMIKTLYITKLIILKVVIFLKFG